MNMLDEDGNGEVDLAEFAQMSTMRDTLEGKAQEAMRKSELAAEKMSEVHEKQQVKSTDANSTARYQNHARLRFTYISAARCVCLILKCLFWGWCVQNARLDQLSADMVQQNQRLREELKRNGEKLLALESELSPMQVSARALAHHHARRRYDAVVFGGVDERRGRRWRLSSGVE